MIESMTLRRVFLLAIVFLILSPIALFTAIVMHGPLAEKETVIIPHGSSVRDIATLLQDHKAIANVLVFRLAAKIIANNMLKSGEYEIAPQQNVADIVLMMHDGRSVSHMFTVTEGMTSAEIANALRSKTILTGDVETPPDGSLLPETYKYNYGDSRSSLITRMQKAMQDTVNNLWAHRDPTVLVATPVEAVTLASIIEKETGKVAERPRIAGVFYNRLRTHMRLQSDPTTIYAITHARGTMNRALMHDDLAFVSPYNTYVSDGLPPSPICNPGRAAIEAALHPENHDYFYFVADGTGGHAFAHDLAAHNKNINSARGLNK
jgi:UPF0755 protein